MRQFLTGKNIAKILISLISVLLSAWMVKTIVELSSYSVLVADDFIHANGVGYDPVNILGHVKRSIGYAIRFYKGWQGTYFSMFLQALLSPLNGHGLAQLKVVMVVNALLFFFSLIEFLWVAMQKISTSEHYAIKLIVITIVIFLFLNRETYVEIFTWYSGSTSYSFPLSFLLLGMTFMLLNQGKDKVVYAVFSCIFGFIAMGGSLAVAGTGCYLAMMVCFYQYLHEKKVSKPQIVTFVIWLIGAIINTVAPGNFVRHDMASSGASLSPISAVSKTFFSVEDHLQSIMRSSDFVALIMLVVLLGMIIGKENIKVKEFNYSSILMLILPFVTLYPLELGYDGGEIPDRVIFVVDFSIIIACVYFALSFGIWVANQAEISFKQSFVVFSVITILGFASDSYGIQYANIKYVSDQMAKGTYSDYYNECVNFYTYLESLPKGEDCYISTADCPQELDNIYNFYLNEDPTVFPNADIAEYYGLKSIVTYTPEE